MVAARIIWLLTPALCLLTTFGWAAVSAQLSATQIDELESVRLTIRAGETRQTQTLDLSALEADFHVMGTNTSSQYRFTNGREQSWVDYQITLQPKRVGTLIIPSIAIGRDQTPTMTLEVRRLSSETRQKIDQMVFFENDISSDTIYVQGQLILTRRLLYSQGVQLYSDLPGAPDIENAVVQTLGETTSETTTRAGQTYGMVEQRYAIFPEASGDFVIPGIIVTASVRLVDRGRVSRKGVQVGTEPITVRVKPVPAIYPAGEPWLPAQNVSALQTLEPTLNVAVGDTLTHELLLHIIGNVGSVAPPQELELAPNEFRLYPQSPVINDDTNGDQVVGLRLQTTSIVPLVPGSLAVPGQKIYWWNTRSDEIEIATTETITLQTTGTAVNEAASSPSVVGQQNAPQSAPDDAMAEYFNLTELAELNKIVDSFDTRLGLTIFAVTSVGIFVIALLARIFRAQGPWRLRRASPQIKILKKAVSANDFHRQLCNLLGSFTHQNPAEALLEFENRFPEVAAPLEKLRASAYRPGAPELAAAERKLIMATVKQYICASTKHKPLVLPPLYSHETPAASV